MLKRHALLISLLATGIIACQITLFSLRPQTLETALVSRVIDGDTLDLSDGRTIRLLNINTPEKGEPFSKESSAFLSELTNKSVQIQSAGLDKYQRTLARIYSPNYINLEIVRRGLASHFLVDDSEISEFSAAEKEAISAGKGMWAHSPYYLCITAEVNKIDEKVFLHISCNASTEGWYLRDESRKMFYFPGNLQGEITLFSGKGINNGSSLFWNQGNVWNDDRDSIYIFDKNGGLIYAYSYGY